MRPLALAAVLAALVFTPTAAAWTWPADGPVLQPFLFDPAHPYAGGQHRGIDVGGDSGADVRAPATGVVTFAGTVPASGRSLTVETAAGLSVTLTHLGTIDVAKGASVAEGDAVATIGASGEPEVATPYVHLGVRVAAEPQGYLDPLSFLPPRVAPTQTPPPAPAAPTRRGRPCSPGCRGACGRCGGSGRDACAFDAGAAPAGGDGSGCRDGGSPSTGGRDRGRRFGAACRGDRQPRGRAAPAGAPPRRPCNRLARTRGGSGSGARSPGDGGAPARDRRRTGRDAAARCGPRTFQPSSRQSRLRRRGRLPTPATVRLCPRRTARRVPERESGRASAPAPARGTARGYRLELVAGCSSLCCSPPCCSRRPCRSRAGSGVGRCLSWAAMTFYVTTPIYYVNTKPHIGHAYTTIAADILDAPSPAAGRGDVLPHRRRRARDEGLARRRGAGACPRRSTSTRSPWSGASCRSA